MKRLLNRLALVCFAGLLYYALSMAAYRVKHPDVPNVPTMEALLWR